MNFSRLANFLVKAKKNAYAGGGKEISPQYKENPIKNYVQHTRADTAKAEGELGFKAKIPLESGIEKLIEYYKK